MKATDVNEISLEVSKLYNKIIRTPANWEEEKERLSKNPNLRANWKYDIPNLSPFKKLVEDAITDSSRTNNSSSKAYKKFEKYIVKRALKNSRVKVEILSSLKSKTFKSNIKLRKDFFDLSYNFNDVIKSYNTLLAHKNVWIPIGKKLSDGTKSPTETAKDIKLELQKAIQEISTIISFPEAIKKDVLSVFKAEVKVIDDPSFIMRCTTDPKTKVTTVFLNKNRKYSKMLTKIGALHEFAGHGLEMATFDNSLIPKGIAGSIYGYAGISSPNPFDAKAEVFADKIVYPFLKKDEKKYMEFRRNAWITCRAMGDYLYHFKKATIQDVARIFDSLGLGDFSFDEAIMASIFIEGYQGMYYFANNKIDDIEEESHLSENEFLTKLLLLGKIPVEKFHDFNPEEIMR